MCNTILEGSISFEIPNYSCVWYTSVPFPMLGIDLSKEVSASDEPLPVVKVWTLIFIEKCNLHISPQKWMSKVVEYHICLWAKADNW